MITYYCENCKNKYNYPAELSAPGRPGTARRCTICGEEGAKYMRDSSKLQAIEAPPVKAPALTVDETEESGEKPVPAKKKRGRPSTRDKEVSAVTLGTSSTETGITLTAPSSADVHTVPTSTVFPTAEYIRKLAKAKLSESVNNTVSNICTAIVAAVEKDPSASSISYSVTYMPNSSLKCLEERLAELGYTTAYEDGAPTLLFVSW